MPDNAAHQGLFPLSVHQYGPANYQPHVLELYKTYVQTTQETSRLRYQANTFFLSINSAIIGYVGYVGATSNNGSNLLVAVAGLVLCYTWHRLLKSYRQLNSAKFGVIVKLEQQLPVAAFAEEYQELKKGIGKNKYRSLSATEKNVPYIFGLLHSTSLIYFFISWAST